MCIGEYKRKRRPRKKPGRHPVLYTNSYLASLCVLLISLSGLELVGLFNKEWTRHLHKPELGIFINRSSLWSAGKNTGWALYYFLSFL